MVENEMDSRIKCLRSDNGGEFTSKEFMDYCSNHKIKRQFSITRTPQQIGVVERKNRSIIEATRAMLHDQSLSKFLWGEAANTAVYVQNRCPHQALDFKILEEVFTDKKLDGSHLRIFGSPVYFHVPKEKRSKLDAFWKKETFVGYSETSKAYRIYVLGQREVELSHDVTSMKILLLERSEIFLFLGRTMMMLMQKSQINFRLMN